MGLLSKLQRKCLLLAWSIRLRSGGFSLYSLKPFISALAHSLWREITNNVVVIRKVASESVLSFRKLGPEGVALKCHSHLNIWSNSFVDCLRIQ